MFFNDVLIFVISVTSIPRESTKVLTLYSDPLTIFRKSLTSANEILVNPPNDVFIRPTSVDKFT